MWGQKEEARRPTTPPPEKPGETVAGGEGTLAEEERSGRGAGKKGRGGSGQEEPAKQQPV